MAAPALSPDCLGWVRVAGYAWSTDDSTETLVPRSQMGPPTTRYLIRQVRDRLRLTQADDDADERTLLYAADREVLERFLYGVFDDVREDLDLPFLDLAYAASDLAAGYSLSDMVRGYRTLTRAGQGPVAAAPDPILSLLALVPLSHLIGWSLTDLKRAFLSPGGVPLLREAATPRHSPAQSVR